MSISPLIVITGPTAVGKTKLAVALAVSVQGEIINADSRQVYKQMDIGTGKDLAEYELDGKVIPHHLINICEPGYRYNIKEYQQDFTTVYEALLQKQKPAILCGGSGLYIESALEGNPFAFVPVNQARRGELEDESKSKLISLISGEVIDQLNISTDTTSKRLVRAVEISEFLKKHSPQKKEPKRREAIIFAIKLNRSAVLERIIIRLKQRLENGLIEEIESLLQSGLTPEQLLYYGLEYRWVTMYVLKEMTYDEMFERLNISIRQFAKRQMTWFRRMEKKGYELNWLDGSKSTEDLRNEVLERLKDRSVGG
jgi:tRNA dimethylallyltransferase